MSDNESLEIRKIAFLSSRLFKAQFLGKCSRNSKDGLDSKVTFFFKIKNETNKAIRIKRCFSSYF